ncbi:MAG: LytR/AlgR family response regulator transcription factor [Lentimicrobium sp.]
MTRKISCLVINDEPIAVRVIADYIGRVPSLVLAGTFTNALASIPLLQEGKVDLLFLDIEMPEVTGFGFLKSLPHPPAVVFITAYRNYAADAFDVDALDYLLKPVAFERFLLAVHKYLNYTLAGHTLNAPPAKDEFIVLKSDKLNHRVRKSDIFYIESLDDYVKVYIKDKTLVCYLRLTGLEQVLGGQQFIRIHRAYLVNRQYITAFSSSSVEIGGKNLPVGRSYRDNVGKLLAE